MAYTVSAEFLSLLTKSHKIVTKVELLKSGAVQTLPAGVNFNVIAGSMTEDRANSIRRTMTLELVDPSGQLSPTSLNSLLAPFKNELKLYRGIQTSVGPEYVPLGVFGFREVVTDDDGRSLKIQINGFDRSDIVARQRFITPYRIAAGTAIEVAIQGIINTRIASPVYVSTVTGFTTPTATYDVGADPWQACTELAQAAGCEVFFDNIGRVIIQPEPDPSTAPVNWTYASGFQATITKIDRSFAAPQYNHVIESGESSNIIPPVSASASDTNSNSPTWTGYGDFPLFHVSPFLQSVAQCQAAASARLLKVLGATENVSFQGLVNPALAGSDVIVITQPRVAISQVVYVVDKVVTPMGADGTQSCSVRARTVS